MIHDIEDGPPADDGQTQHDELGEVGICDVVLQIGVLKRGLRTLQNDIPPGRIDLNAGYLITGYMHLQIII